MLKAKKIQKRVPYSTTIPAELMALVQGLFISELSPIIGDRIERGSISQLTETLLIDSFEKLYGVKMLILLDLLRKERMFTYPETSEMVSLRFNAITVKEVQDILKKAGFNHG